MPLRIIITSGFLISILGACAPYQYSSVPVETLYPVEAFHKRSFSDPELDAFLSLYDETSDREWDLATLTLAGYYFNPRLQIAIENFKKAGIQQETINQRINPVLGLPFEYHSDTSGGKSPFLIGLVLDFVLERQPKREARLDKAEASTDLTMLNIYAVAWDIYSKIRKHYVDYYIAWRLRQNLENQLETTEGMLALLEKRFNAGQVSDFEVNSIRLEFQRVKITLSHQRLAEVEARLSLAGAIGVPGSALEEITVSFLDVERLLVSENIVYEQTLERALTHRLDIRMALQEYAVFEAALRLEIEKQYPDLVLSPGFIFDQNDNIWALGASWVLPLFHTQNEAAILKSLADRRVKQAEFMTLQAKVINETELVTARLEARIDTREMVINLHREARERQEILQKQFDVGYADRLQLYRSFLETGLTEQSLIESEKALIRQAGMLEDVMQFPLGPDIVKTYQYTE